MNKLIERLAASDPGEADAAGRALLRSGRKAVPALLAAAATAPTAARRRVMFLLGRIDPPPALAVQVRRALEQALADDDWKVRRNAAVSLGEIAESASADALFEQLARDADPRVRSSLVLAIGNTAGPDALGRLRAVSPQNEAEADALRKSMHSIEGRAGHLSRIDAAREIPAAVLAELWTRHGIADIAVQEARSTGLGARVRSDDRVRVGPPCSFQRLMTVRSALYPVITFEPEDSIDDPTALGRAFDNSPAAHFMRAVTEAPVTYRASLAIDLQRFRRRNEWIAAFASRCSLENRATAYAWELIVRQSNGAVVLGARPAALPDERFWYRERDVPASLHPTLAAAAVLLPPASPDDVVVDPFCGAGTLLAERARLGPYRALIGIDISDRALDAAQANLKPFARVTLQKDDFPELRRHAPIDLILSNPPYGRRVGKMSEIKDSYRRLDELGAQALKPGGWLVVLRPLEVAPPAKLEVVSTRRVDVGGFDVNLMAARRT